MPDWRAEVRRRLEPLDLPPAREASIVEELAAHVADRYDELRARGLSLFLSFYAEDLRRIRGFRLMARNPNLALDFADRSLMVAIDSERAPYVRSVLKGKIARAEVVCCLIGNGTAWRKWIDWELGCAAELGKGICAVRLKNSRGRTPPFIRERGIPVAAWGTASIVAAIGHAAAVRSKAEQPPNSIEPPGIPNQE